METYSIQSNGRPEGSLLNSCFKRGYIQKAMIKAGLYLLDITLGFIAGALGGWAVGWRAGVIYKNYSEPANFPGLEQVRAWDCLPITWANRGLIIGAVLGAVLLYWYSRKTRHSHTDHTTTTNTFHERNLKMNKTNMICVTLLSMFFLFGCLPSLHPLYTDETLTFDEQLIGKWYSDGEMWSFYKTGDKEYGMKIYSDAKKRPAEFTVHLVQLDQYRFIDLYPTKQTIENSPEASRFNMIPAHTFMKVDLREPNLLAQWVCFGDLIEDDPNLLKHEKLDDEPSILITAQPEDIQRVLLENLDKVMGDDKPGELKRCPMIFSQEDIVFDQRLLGQWESSNGDYADIMEWQDGGYDILASDKPGEELHFNAKAFQFGNQLVLGLYIAAPCQKEVESGLHLIPDLVMLVEQIEPQLKLRGIDWDDILSTSMAQAVNDSLNQSSEPDCVFERIMP